MPMKVSKQDAHAHKKNKYTVYIANSIIFFYVLLPTGSSGDKQLPDGCEVEKHSESELPTASLTSQTSLTMHETSHASAIKTTACSVCNTEKAQGKGLA